MSEDDFAEQEPGESLPSVSDPEPETPETGNLLFPIVSQGARYWTLVSHSNFSIAALQGHIGLNCKNAATNDPERSIKARKNGNINAFIRYYESISYRI